VNPYGAASLLIYLKQAASLEVLLIYNCGLGSGGAAKIAEGFAGTPRLKTLSIGRNRIEGDGAKSIAENLKHIPLLEELMIYQNGIKNDLIHLFKSLRQNCKNLSVLDIQDNFLTSIETTE
jgi:Ran GTPase-activating protein (RanGAP) involved in mRNA processing and transport